MFYDLFWIDEEAIYIHKFCSECQIVVGGSVFFKNFLREKSSSTVRYSVHWGEAEMHEGSRAKK